MENQKYFAKAFFEEWVKIQPQLSPAESQILYYMIHRMDRSNNAIFGTKEIKELADEINSTERSVRTTLSVLLKRNPALIMRNKDAYFTYIVCPDLAIKLGDNDFDEIKMYWEWSADKETDSEVLTTKRVELLSKGKVIKTVKEEKETKHWNNTRLL